MSAYRSESPDYTPTASTHKTTGESFVRLYFYNGSDANSVTAVTSLNYVLQQIPVCICAITAVKQVKTGLPVTHTRCHVLTLWHASSGHVRRCFSHKRRWERPCTFGANKHWLSRGMMRRNNLFIYLFIYLFNIKLVQQYTRKEKEKKEEKKQQKKTHAHRNYNKTRVKTKLYIVSQSWLQRRPY